MPLDMHMTRPGRYGFDASRLARIDAFVKQRYLDSGKLPHAQLLLARDGEIAHFSHQGSAREGGAPVDEGTLFRIASMTKPIIGAAIMMLVEDGRIRLQDPVSRYIPTFKAMKLYRNYDGNKSGFGDTSVAATVPNPDNLSAFAALRSACRCICTPPRGVAHGLLRTAS